VRSPWQTISLDEFRVQAEAQIDPSQHKHGCPTAEYVDRVTALSQEFGFEVQAARCVRLDGSVYTIFRRKPEE